MKNTEEDENIQGNNMQALTYKISQKKRMNNNPQLLNLACNFFLDR